MSTIKLTQLAVERIGKPAAGRVEYFDSLLPGFGLRVAASGHKSWIVFYRFQGKLRRYTIGSIKDEPVADQARAAAREIMREVSRGADPAAEKKASKAAPKAAPEPPKEKDTVRSVAAQFVELHCKPNNRSWAETERTLRNHVISRWGNRELASITRQNIRSLLADLVSEGHPIAANRTLAAVRKMFAWAVDEEILSTSPVKKFKAPAKENERDRVLSDDELTRVWEASGKLGSIIGGFVRVLILTGQRRDEVGTMRWRDINLETKVWTLPREVTKADRSHEVPLSPLAISVLAGLPRLGDFVFTTRGDRPISGYSSFKERLDKFSGVDEDWRFHDLRRTAGTGMARLGIAGSTISRVLNHAEGGVTKIYNRYSYLDEKRHALETWAAHVDRMLSPPHDNVVALRA